MLDKAVFTSVTNAFGHKDVTKLARLKRGQRVIVDDEFLNSLADSDESVEGGIMNSDERRESYIANITEHYSSDFAENTIASARFWCRASWLDGFAAGSELLVLATRALVSLQAAYCDQNGIAQEPHPVAVLLEEAIKPATTAT